MTVLLRVPAPFPVRAATGTAGAPIADRCRTAYGPEASSYDRRTSAFQAYRERIVESLPLSAGDRVLDVGCGTGLCFAALQRAVGPTGEIVGVDESAAMTALAAERVLAAGWDNVTLVSAAADVAPLAGLFDAALFCAAHDILQSPAALRHVLSALRPGAWIAAGGGKLVAPMLLALNLQVRALHGPFVRSFEGFDRPWSHLERLVGTLQVEELAVGTGYTAVGRLPG